MHTHTYSMSSLLVRVYQAKQGYCIYRVRVKRGDRKKRVAKVHCSAVHVQQFHGWGAWLQFPTKAMGCK